MEYVTVKNYARLKGCSIRTVQYKIASGKLTAVKESGDNNCMRYLIPINELTDTMLKDYRSESTMQVPVLPITDKASSKKDFGEFSEKDRKQIAFWTKIIEEWKVKRKEYSSVETGDMVFIEETKRIYKEELSELNIKISRDILYRKYKYYKENKLEGLCEHRGGSNKGYNSIPSELSQVFSDLYLCDREMPVSDCFRLTKEWAVENKPELLADMPSEQTFRRFAKTIPEAVVKYFRSGEKACRDECLPYIIRLYENISANDVWVADNHTFDFITVCEGEQRKHRLYITGLLDAKTEALVGWNITENPCSESTVLALRHAIMRCGIPKILYVDNGTEFLTHDIGGKGHRKRKSMENVPVPPTILDRLGIKMVNALVCNGRAKPIERMFLTLKNTISRCVSTFTGGNVVERPESLKWQIKHGIIPWDMEIKEKLDILLEGYNGSLYGGCESKYKGLTRAECWCSSFVKSPPKRCDISTLNLLLMRNTRYQTVRENGVYITISGEKLYYNSGIDNWKYVGKEVYVRYDPSDLESVKVYDKSDKYLADWTLDKSVFVDYITVNNEDIADRQRLIGRQLRAIKEYGSELTGNMQIDALALAVEEARRKIEKVHFDEIPETQKTEMLAVGAECLDVNIDMKAMAQRASERLNRKD